LDFGDNPDHDADAGIFTSNFYHCGYGNLTSSVDEVGDEIFEECDVLEATNDLNLVLIRITIRIQVQEFLTEFFHC